tara:strand:- start:1753 stop:1869 length:117 start_codon:yes stop_codon:yes gene_type:complete
MNYCKFSKKYFKNIRNIYVTKNIPKIQSAIILRDIMDL